MQLRIHTLACAILALCSCTKTIEREVIEYVPVEPVTYYYYGNTSYSVHRLQSYYEEGYYYFLIAREPEDPFNSRIELIVPEYNIGKILDFSNVSLSKGIDYVLLFEDPTHYYSPDYAPKSGTLQVRKNAAKDSYKLKFDLILPDGENLRFDYSGTYPEAL